MGSSFGEKGKAETPQRCVQIGVPLQLHRVHHTQSGAGFQAGNKKGLRRDLQRHRKPVQDGRLKSFCLLYLLEEPEVQLGLFFQALCGRKFLTW